MTEPQKTAETGKARYGVLLALRTGLAVMLLFLSTNTAAADELIDLVRSGNAQAVRAAEASEGPLEEVEEGARGRGVREGARRSHGRAGGRVGTSGRGAAGRREQSRQEEAAQEAAPEGGEGEGSEGGGGRRSHRGGAERGSRGAGGGGAAAHAGGDSGQGREDAAGADGEEEEGAGGQEEEGEEDRGQEKVRRQEAAQEEAGAPRTAAIIPRRSAPSLSSHAFPMASESTLNWCSEPKFPGTFGELQDRSVLADHASSSMQAPPQW